jgi:hypothetical protein
MSENVVDINVVRRVRNMEKAVVTFESQLAAIKKSMVLLSEHRDFRFFSIMCHELAAEKKKIAEDLLKLRIRLQKAKDELNKEIQGIV